MNAWNAKHRQRVRKREKESYRKNAEHYIEKAKDYYEQNREKILAQHAENYDPEAKSAYNKEWWKTYSKNICDQINGMFGTKCFFCRSEVGDVRKKHPNLHEIHGKKHPSLRNKKSIKYLQEHKEDFRPLCSQCHTGVHFLMKFGYQWEEIEEIVKRKSKA